MDGRRSFRPSRLGRDSCRARTPPGWGRREGGRKRKVTDSRSPAPLRDRSGFSCRNDRLSAIDKMIGLNVAISQVERIACQKVRRLRIVRRGNHSSRCRRQARSPNWMRCCALRTLSNTSPHRCTNCKCRSISLRCRNRNRFIFRLTESPHRPPASVRCGGTSGPWRPMRWGDKFRQHPAQQSHHGLTGFRAHGTREDSHVLPQLDRSSRIDCAVHCRQRLAGPGRVEIRPVKISGLVGTDALDNNERRQPL